MLRRVDREALLRRQQFAGERIDGDDALDLVAPEVDAHGEVLVRGEDRQRVAAHAEGAAHEVHVVARVLHVDQLADQRVAIDVPPDVQLRDERLVLARLAEAVDAGHRGDDQHVAVFEQRARRRVAHLVDLFVDVGVLGDVGVRARDVRLGLVVVVVGDEVLDRVAREEVAELRGQLRGQRAVGREHQRRPLVLGDDVRHREGLAGAGGPEHGLHRQTAIEALAELLDRPRLVARRPEIADQLEPGARCGGHAVHCTPQRAVIPPQGCRRLRTTGRMAGFDEVRSWPGRIRLSCAAGHQPARRSTPMTTTMSRAAPWVQDRSSTETR